MAFCNRCGSALPEDSGFCLQCGAPVATLQPPPPAPGAAPPAAPPPAYVPPAPGACAPPPAYAPPAPPQAAYTPPVSAPPPSVPAPPPAGAEASVPAPAAEDAGADEEDTPPAKKADGAPRPVVPPPFPLASAQGADTPPPGALQVQKSGGRLFVERFVGVFPAGIFFLFAMALAVASIMRQDAVQVLLVSYFMAIPLAMAMAVSWRACGPDLSAGYLAMLPPMFIWASGNVEVGIIIGLVAAIALGFVNGALIYGFRLPSTLVTLGVGMLVAGFSALVTNYQPKMLNFRMDTATVLLVAVGVFVVAVGGAFCYIFFTRLRVPFARRTDKDRRSITLLFAYPIAGLLAGLGGVLYALRTASFTASPVYGLSPIALIWAVLACSSLCDNRVGPVIGGIVATVIYAFTNTGLLVLGDNVSSTFVFAVMTAVLLIPAGLARWPFGKQASTHYLQQ